MQTLSVLAVEDGAIIVASPTGERFRLPVDAALRARLASISASPDEKRLSPREIQAHIRSGLTAQQVAAMTGVPVAFIERFVGPVLAERAYIVESALAVRLPPETEGARSRTFGAVMGERLDALAAKDVRWTSAKEPSGWVLAVAFVADDVQHDARWRFDPKHMRLDPDNVEASTLSQQGVPAALTPRLRAIEPTAPVTVVRPATGPIADDRPALPHGARTAPAEPDRTRFDSAVFRLPPLTEDPRPAEPAAVRDAVGSGEERPAASTGPATDPVDQLSRRRGQRRPAPEIDDDELPPTRAMDVVETGDVFAPRPAGDRKEPAPVHRLPVRTPAPEAPAEERRTEPLRRRRDRGRSGLAPVEPARPEPAAQPERTAPAERPVPRPGPAQRTPQPPRTPQPERGRPAPEPEQPAEPPAARPRRGRTSMPSWDEIVFGRDEP